ncbi:efflux RND transporter periplasmic adaptor subunit [Pelagivirga sediminicola]|uniref:Efflux RND transporter periplasmic adaptor subunit n=2 Tax=Pelagivirga sediminicola TaxID=2170575 RepID=A0A2T7G538_9RHOB|nr:efflux RND transporter periplasmic adaptor subunit [Pelagivirga sediminicola]
MTVGQAETGMTREFYGKVVARQTVDLAFQTGGQLIEFPLVEGQTVEQGALVARLDPEPFELALGQARLRQSQAARDLDRLSRLSNASVSQAARDDARTNEGLAMIALRDAERALAQATLTAPFEALVAERLVANFSTVAAGTPVARLHDMSELRVEVEVPEILFQQAGRNPDVSIHANFPAGDRSYPLEIREFTSDAAAVGQTFKLTLAFAADDAPDVLPGSSVTVSARRHLDDAGLAVPASALVPEPGGAVFVMVYEGDKDGATVHRRKVALDVAEDGSFRVTSGLQPGEQIVAAGATALKDGQTVRRFTGFPN